MGHTAIAVSNPISGLELICDNPPDFFDVIMLDMLMPEISGVDLVQKICQINHEIPIVVVTSFKEDAVRSALRTLEQDHNLLYGINYFVLEKPLVPENVKELIQKLL
jgi:CheY-like chemotaxis protein